MEIIQADYVEMLNRKDRLLNLLRELVNEIDSLKYVLNDIDIFWEGEANEAFHLSLNEDFAIMDVLCLKLSMAFEKIGEAVSEYVLTDITVSGIIGG